MRIDALQRRVIMDAEMLASAVEDILPIVMPPVYAHHQMYMGSFVKRLRLACLDFNVHHTLALDPEVKTKEIRISGEWYPSQLLPINDTDADIQITWLVGPGGRRQAVTPTNWPRIRFAFWSYVMHELVHRAQDTFRGDVSSRVFKPEAADPATQTEQRYLGDYDEIEAYAHGTALEMLCWYTNLPFSDAFRLMKLEQQDNADATYPIYRKTFAGNLRHPAMKVFNRKVNVWYNSICAHRAFYDQLGLQLL